MFGAIFKATNSSFQKGMTFCRSIYVKKVMKLLAFIFEQPSYLHITRKVLNILWVANRIKAQTSLHIHALWSAALLFAYW